MNGLVPLVAWLGGLFLVFAGERMFGAGTLLRLPLDGLGVLGLVVALALRARRWMSSSGETRTVLGRLVPAYALGLVGVLVYFAAAAGSPVGLEGRAHAIALIAGLLLCLLASAPLLLMELSLLSMYGAQALETRRLLDSSRAGLAVALVAAFVGFANFAGDARSERIDLRTVRDLLPTEQTLQMARNVSEPLTITLFFPPANDVAEEIEPYFAALDAASDQVSVERLDRDMHPVKAKELRARQNGTVVISQGETHESLQLDTDPDKARRKLKKLDKDFQEKLAKVSRKQRIAYFTVGHGERSTSPREDEIGLKLVKEVLQQLNYKVKKLGLNDGLSNAVPDDATVVFVAGPTVPMLPAEQDALIRYARGGGALVLLLDPEEERPLELDPLLEALGLTVDRTLLAHETKFVTMKKALSDRTFLATNRFTSHDSTPVLSKNSSRMFVLFNESGSLDKREGVAAKDAGGPDVQFTVRSMSGTFGDLDGDLEHDSAEEKKKVWQMLAAVQLAAPEGGDGKGGRALVAADVDVLADYVIGASRGNQQLLVDGLRWLEDEVELTGEVAEIEDVAILHTRDEDKAWFWGTTLGMPLLVLGFGLATGRSRRRRTTR
jgi:hypothetical protein